MRYGIFSDIHSNLEAFQAVISAYKKEGIDRYLCAGDVVGYAADPSLCIEQVKGLGGVTVAGNHDWACVDLFSLEYFNPLAVEALSWTRDNLREEGKSFLKRLETVYQDDCLTLVHGALDEPGNFNYLADGYIAQKSFALLKTDICFLGHTHSPGIFFKEGNGGLHYTQEEFCKIIPGNRYIVNLGSVGQPRDGNPEAAYCIYDSEKKQVVIKRTGYDINAAKGKINAAGLPGYLGERLFAGR